jgi:hypothetical protein
MARAIDTSGHLTGEAWNRRKNGEEHPAMITRNTVKNDS